MIAFFASLFLFVTANSFLISALFQNRMTALLVIACAGMSFLFAFFPTLLNKKKKSKKIQMCYNGCVQLTAFLLSSVFSILFTTICLAGGIPAPDAMPVSAAPFWAIHVTDAVVVEAVLFWCGIIRIYLSSSQIGMKWRVIGILCGMIPIVHLFVLFRLISLAGDEVKLENDKLLLNEARKEQQICRTKYPLLMVHGVFFRDFRYFNYWGRVPDELTANGASVYYGNQESALSVEDSAAQLAERIREVLKESGSDKVNIIAHSKGGLDSRYAIDKLEMAPCVASLTTINTPHRGCEFADYLLNKIPAPQKQKIAAAYNASLKKLGDKNPDFIAAVTDLTASACQKRNEEISDSPLVCYRSIGSCLKKPVSGTFPLNLTNVLVGYFDGKNDGLVGEESFAWGEEYTFLENKGMRGISHGDMIDLNRENIPGFDVREFYVQLVAELKEKGF